VSLALAFLLVFLPTQCWGISPGVYILASAATGIPLELILAVSHVESGFQPSAINVAGRSFFPLSRHEAESILKGSGANVDIGLMQINWGHWGKKLGLSKSDLLDPRLNVFLGATILEHCVRARGDWWKGVGLYHSPHDSRQRAYVEKVWQSYRRVLIKMRK
jgi:soluble lytic murein transglycosylase-like protein